MLMQEYYFDCCCARCAKEDVAFDPRQKFLHQLERTGKLATLNRAALHYEVENPPACLKALVLLLEGVKQNQEAGREAQLAGDDYQISTYSSKLRKDLLERAVYMAIRMRDFE